jgi:predicted MPP superfamily phosphohydrolase
MDEANIKCLDNSITTLHVEGLDLQLVGLSDRYSFLRGVKRPIKELFSKLDKDIPTILLAHQPKDVEYIKENRVDVQLSGHTHGGQIYPLNLLVKLFQPYFSGLYAYNNTLLYVTNGLGYWGIKIRYKAPSEIPIITIN